MDDPNQPLSKEKAIKRFLLIVIGTIAFAAAILYLEYGRFPIKSFLISLAIILPIMIISAIIGYKYRQQILQIKNKFTYVYIILGIGIIIIDGILVILGEGGINSYVGIVAGFILLFYGIKQMRKN